MAYRRLLHILAQATLLTVILTLCSPGFAEEGVEYNRDVRPILAEHCFACHGADSASREAGLRLDVRDEAIAYGALVPGGPEDSTLVERIFTPDADLVMPPPETKKTLSSAQKETLRQWIAAGAAYQPHWSYLVPQRPALPEIDHREWPRNAIDYFVAARLEEAGLQPAESDPARALFRRLHLDLTGLPPAPADMERFVLEFEANEDTAVAAWIDHLLESEAWGEHRARYWLDSARYADTHGVHFDNYREMWPYRDWVIRAFNRNQPFDAFLVEQLAGDLLPTPTDEQLIATGFQRCNPTTNEGGTIEEENLANYAADRVQTFGWVFLGLTLNCAQCHDHKFDPITMRDYYSLAAFFRNTTAPALDGNSADGNGPVLVLPAEADRQRWKAIPTEMAETKAQIDQQRKDARGAFGEWSASATPADVGRWAPANGMVVHLPLNEGSQQSMAPLTENTEQINVSGNVTWQPDGPLGPAPVLGDHCSISLGAVGDFEKNEPFSFGCWVKTTSAAQSASILARLDVEDNYRGWDLWLDHGKLSVHLIDSWADNTLKVTTSASVVSNDRWQHVLVTYDGSAKPGGITIYVDGKQVPHQISNNTLTPDASIRTKTPLMLGRRSAGQGLVSSSIQDVRIYNRTLDAAEAFALSQLPLLTRVVAAGPAGVGEQDLASAFEAYLAIIDQQYQSLTSRLRQLEAEQLAIRKRSPITHIQQEKADSQPMTPILQRGAYDQPGEMVKADTPEALHPMPTDAPTNRLGLAQWVVDRRNPLTARVTVNRFWQEVFGQGLVSTTEDFGVSGNLPSHPELLDWLAMEFVESGWDVKHLFRLMLNSATYRQSVVVSAEKLETDPSNQLLSRGPRFRMDAEMIRDQALAVSGLLSRQMYGPGVKPYQPENIWNMVGLPGGDTREYVQDTGENLYRRSIYSFWKRMAPPPNLEAFNAPSREVCVVRRERTNTPLQALVTLNDPQFVEAARRLAEHSLEAQDDRRTITSIMADRVLGRPLSGAEESLVRTSFEGFKSHYDRHPEDAEALIAVGESSVLRPADPATLAAWTMVANQLLNLDETLTK